MALITMKQRACSRGRPSLIPTRLCLIGVSRWRSDRITICLLRLTVRTILNIREDKGYTYSPVAFLAPYKETGVLVTRADVRNAVTAPSFNEISYELNRVATTAPEPDEVERAKRYSIGSLAVFLQPHKRVWPANWQNIGPIRLRQKTLPPKVKRS
jgi:hypothetical protein